VSIKLYDEAILTKFKGVFKNTVYAPTDEAFARCAELNEGKVLLPLISIYRPEFMTIDNTNLNKPAFFQGRPFEVSEKDLEGQPLKIKNLRTLAVTLRYQADVWGKKEEEYLRLTEELLFWLIANPYVKITEPLSGKELEFSIILEDNIMDNTDITGFQERGRLYRCTFEFEISHAQLFSLSEIDNLVASIEITEEFI